MGGSERVGFGRPSSRPLHGGRARCRRACRGAGARGAGLALVLVAVSLALSPVAALAVPGGLTQLTGTAGCVSETGTGGACQDGRALSFTRSVTVSPDGEHAYATSAGNSAVAILDRSPVTGELTQLSGTAGCVSETGGGGACQDGKALDPRSVAVSPDGEHAYVASVGSNAVAIFDRSPVTGELTQLSGAAGCISETGTGGACQDGKALDGAFFVVVSPDGEHAYVASVTGNAVAVFDRNPQTGELAQLAGTAGCISETGTGGACQDGKALNFAQSVTLSREGEHAYVASGGSDAIAILDRNTQTGELAQLAGTAGCISETGTGGACQDGKALDDTRSVIVSPDGEHAYVASAASSAVAVFDRNPLTGELTQLSGTAGCISETGTGGACHDGKALDVARSVAVSPDGEHAYVASVASDAIAILDRNTQTGELAQLAGTAGCISETGTGGACEDGKALDGALSMAVSPDGEHSYAAADASGAVAIFDREAPRSTAAPSPSPPGEDGRTDHGGDPDDGEIDDEADGDPADGEQDETAVAGTSASDDGGELPFTGLALPLIAAIGTVLLLCGGALRRHTRRR